MKIYGIESNKKIYAKILIYCKIYEGKLSIV